MKAYQVYIPYDVYVFLKDLKPKPREKISRFLEFLAENPNYEGDYKIVGESGRLVEVKLIDKWAIAFWPDHPVLEVKINQIGLNDRPW